MKISENGLNIITTYNVRKTPKVKKIKTTGKHKKVEEEEVVLTEQEKKEMLLERLSPYENFLNKQKNLKLNQNKFDALVSFLDTVNVVNFQESSLYKKMLTNINDLSIASEFLKWNRIVGTESPVLTKRRLAESLLYFS